MIEVIQADNMAPQLIFGTATFGMDATDFQDVDSIQNLLRILQDMGIDHLDTGARYPPMRPGKAEELIGESTKLSAGFTLDTKVYIDTQKDGSGDLEAKAVEQSMQSSLKRLKRSKVSTNQSRMQAAKLTDPKARSMSCMRIEPILLRRWKSRSWLSIGRSNKAIVKQ